MKRMILSIIAITFSLFSNAQEKPAGYEIHYRVIEPVITEDVTLEIIGNHCQSNFCKFRLEITNNTADYIILKTNEIEFVLAHDTYKPTASNVVINPKSSIKKTIKVEGDNRFQVDNYILNLSGFYKASVNGEVAKMENFKLPAVKNNFESGKFHCKVDGKIIKVTKVTEVPCKCTYTGDNVAIIDPSKAVVKLENGHEYATTNTGSKIQLASNDNILFSGEAKKVKAVFKIPGKTADMQFANMEIDWKDVFMETSLQPLTVPSQSFVIDPGLTVGKNK